MNTTRVWLQSLAAAAITGLSTGVTVAIADPTHFNFTQDGLFAILKVSLVTAVLGVAAVLKQSPLPCSDCSKRVAQN